MWDYLRSLWERGLQWFRDTISQGIVEPIRQYVQGAVQTLRDFLAQFGRELSDTLDQVFGGLIDLLGDIFYLFDRLAGVFGLLVKILILMVQVLFATAAGLIRTLVSVAAFDPSSVAPADKSAYATGIDWFIGKGAAVGLDILPSVLAVGVWIGAGLMILRLIGGEDSA